MKEFQRNVAVLPIDQKIRIQRQNGMPTTDFRHADDTGVRKRHRDVTVFPQQRPQSVPVLLNPDATLRAPFSSNSNGVLSFRVARQKVNRLREHRFADEKRRIEVLDAFGDPAVMPFGPIEKSDEGPGVKIATVAAAEAREVLEVRGGREPRN